MLEVEARIKPTIQEKWKEGSQDRDYEPREAEEMVSVEMESDAEKMVCSREWRMEWVEGGGPLPGGTEHSAERTVSLQPVPA